MRKSWNKIVTGLLRIYPEFVRLLRSQGRGFCLIRCPSFASKKQLSLTLGSKFAMPDLNESLYHRVFRPDRH